MKKFAALLSIFLFMSFTINTVSAAARHKAFSQGFYTMKDFNLYEGNTYTVTNTSQDNEGLLIVLNSERIMQQIIRVKPGTKYVLIPLLSDYQFIIFGNIQLVFS